MISPVLAALIRILLVCLFPFSALDKLFDWKGSLQQASSSFLPGGPVLLVLAIIVEVAAPACIVAAWHDRLAAALLAAFCAITALLYHEFWKYSDFWSRGDSQARNHFWDFLKNFGLVGGLLLITFGSPEAPLMSVLAHPLSSTGVYGTPATARPARAGSAP